VGSPSSAEGPQLAVVEGVSCLNCGVVYGKPRAGGTVRENPGCPDCGYVGWVPAASTNVTEESLPSRCAAGLPPRSSG